MDIEYLAFQVDRCLGNPGRADSTAWFQRQASVLKLALLKGKFISRADHWLGQLSGDDVNDKFSGLFNVPKSVFLLTIRPIGNRNHDGRWVGPNPGEIAERRQVRDTRKGHRRNPGDWSGSDCANHQGVGGRGRQLLGGEVHMLTAIRAQGDWQAGAPGRS